MRGKVDPSWLGMADTGGMAALQKPAESRRKPSGLRGRRYLTGPAGPQVQGHKVRQVPHDGPASRGRRPVHRAFFLCAALGSQALRTHSRHGLFGTIRPPSALPGPAIRPAAPKGFAWPQTCQIPLGPHAAIAQNPWLRQASGRENGSVGHSGRAVSKLSIPVGQNRGRGAAIPFLTVRSGPAKVMEVLETLDHTTLP